MYLKITGTKLSTEESKFLDSWIKSPIKLLSSNDYDGIGIARVKEYSNNHYSVTGASSASNDISGREITLVDFGQIVAGINVDQQKIKIFGLISKNINIYNYDT